MPGNDEEWMALDAVRQLEQVRRAAIRDNDADAMDRILDEKFISWPGSPLNWPARHCTRGNLGHGH